MTQQMNTITTTDLAQFVEKPHDMNVYQVIASKSAVFPGKETFAGLAYCALKLNGEAGEVAEKIGKAWRDEGGEITPARRHEIKLELGDVLWYLAAIARELHFDLSDIAVANLNKLHDRQHRGTLRGSGDNR